MSYASDFVIENGVLTKYVGPGGDVVVPDGVQKIGDRAFRWCNSLTSVTIPEGVISIGNNAFDSCKSLTSITIPDSVTSIGNNAFSWCSSLTSITIPDSVISIGIYAFSYCSSLTGITIPDSVTSIGICAFSDCNSLTRATIPDSVTSIADGVFLRCVSLTSIMIPDSVTSIGKNAFSRCSSMTSITIPDSVTSIGDNAFADCSGLTGIRIPESVTSIGKNAFMSNTDDFNIYKGELISYKGPGGDVIIPQGITSIYEKAFSWNKSVTSITIPDSVTSIGKYAFRGCSNLTSIRIPDSVTTIGDNAFSFSGLTEKNAVIPEHLLASEQWICARIGIPDENLCAVRDHALIQHMSDTDTAVVTDGVTSIEENALVPSRNVSKYKNVVLPDSVKNIHRNAFVVLQTYIGAPSVGSQRSKNLPEKMNMPKDYLKQPKDTFDTEMALLLMDTVWRKAVSMDDYVAMYLQQTNKKLLQRCIENFPKNPEKSLEMLMQALPSYSSEAAYEKVARFALENCKKLTEEQIRALYLSSEKAKMKKAVRLLQQYAQAEEKTAETTDPVEAKLRKKYSEYELDQTLAKAKINKNAFDQVRYRDTGTVVPAFVVKCAVVPYIAQAEEIMSFWWNKTRILKEQDEIASLFDAESLRSALTPSYYSVEKPQIFFPLCRFGTSAQIVSLAASVSKWEHDRDSFGRKSRDTAVGIAKEAILLSDTREAMLFAEKNNRLKQYAELRGMDEDYLRDCVLTDFGLDEHGKTTYDLGKTKIEASIGRDLSVGLYDTVAGKVVKSIPKRGVDPELYDSASRAYSDLKKNLKKVVKTRNNKLFDDFLEGKTQTARSWEQSYLENAVLRHVAELIVWNQAEEYFILADNGLIDSSGLTYTLKKSIPVGVAHPMEMKREDVIAWQKYFTSHDLKQPFEQVWEPAHKANEIKPDRYVGCMIPCYRFLNQEKHGIYSGGSMMKGEWSASFRDCTGKTEWVDYSRTGIGPNSLFEIKSLSFKSYTRQVNHIIAYLDRVTVWDRVRKDDLSVTEQLDRFTFAQITEFISAAQEANATNVLAALLDYKNAHFADFDPMTEFTLDW